MNSDFATPPKQKWKLKDPKVLRIFFSSPFNGMEGEREELTRRYFPQFQHACNTNGMRFVAVDMRWGITAEAADNAQVISICLRELDRSDVFIGFFGQRYGWHGTSDELLQKNFDNAVGQYPWLNDVRDRSVTELEYCHGHLNHPGKLPACICFRDKAYDDEKRDKAVAEGNKRNITKYSPESEHSSHMMNDLIERVQATETQLLGLNVKYKNPIEGAKFMFESVWETCLELIADASAIELSPLVRDRACHDAYISSLTSVYIQKDDSLEKLKPENFKSVNGYLIHGIEGSGKSSSLANLVKKLQADGSEFQIVYHFIGSGPGTTSPENILHRIVAELEHICNQVKSDGGGDSVADDGKTEGKMSTVIGKKQNESDVQELFIRMQNEMERIVSLGINLVLVFDGLDKVKAAGKTAKHLYWLPSKFPKGVTVFASTASSDGDTLNLLVKERAFVDVEIQPLSLEVQAMICKEVLMKSGKELSPHQLQKIVDAEQTKNPRFLHIVLSEISIFGYFRLLDNKIEMLVNCNGIKSLLSEVLQRMEVDYNVNDRPLVKEVLSAIAVSHQGLSEDEIQEMFAIPSHAWSPFFFALDNFLISHGGLLRFAYPEMLQAVEDRFLQSENDRLSAMNKLVAYFETLLKTQPPDITLDNLANERVASELPWLQKKMGNKTGLAETISDHKIFYLLQQKSTPELIDLWKDSDMSANDFTSKIQQNFDLAVNDIYNSQMENPEDSLKSPGYLLLPVLTAAKDFFSHICQHQATIKIIKRIIRILEGIDGKIDEHVRTVELRDNYYYLATAHVDDSQYDMAMPLFKTLQNDCEQILSSIDDKSIQQTLAYVYNGIGVLYTRKFQFSEAEPLFQKSAEIHSALGNSVQVADSESNIGLIKLEMGKLQDALEYFNSALQAYEKIYFGHLPLIVGNLLTNIGLCYRRMNKLDLAEEMYNRSLKVKINAVGPQHEVIATAYQNLGILETCRNNYKKMEEFTLKAKEILETLQVKLEQNEMWQVLENLIIALYCQNKHEEALPIFMRVFPMLKREHKVIQGHRGCHIEMMQYMLTCGMFKDVANCIEAYVSSPELREPSYFKILHHCDKQIFSDERPVRPKEQSIEYALKEIWPGNNELTAYYVQNEVLPANDVDMMLDLLNTMDEMNPDFLDSTYDVGAIWCDNEKNYEALLRVAEAGLLKYPESHTLQTRLFDALRQLRRYEEAYKVLLGILDKESDNQGLLLVGGQVAVQANDLELCQKLWKKAETMEDEILAEKAKNALHTLKETLEQAKENDEERKSE